MLVQDDSKYVVNLDENCLQELIINNYVYNNFAIIYLEKNLNLISEIICGTINVESNT